MKCYNDALLAALRTDGTRAALETLEELGAQDETVKRDGHMLAHSIGLASYTTPADVGSVFRQCLPIFQSGCYHGVIQAYFVDVAESGGPAAVNAASINALCDDYRTDPNSRWLLFQCVHGTGHGLDMLYDHNLPRALDGCDLLAAAWDRQGCYGGAFMENIMEATSPHHAIGRPGEDGNAHDSHMAGMDMGGMDMGGSDTASFKLLDPNDPLYPCTVLDARYRHACYEMQTSVVLYYNHGDMAATAKLCDTIEDTYRRACYQSLGRDISAYTVQDGTKARRLCSLGDPRYQKWCHVGFAKNLMDVTADPKGALAYCRMLSDRSSKQACYRGIGEEMWVLSNDPAEWRAACSRAEAGYREVCEAASGLETG